MVTLRWFHTLVSSVYARLYVCAKSTAVFHNAYDEAYLWIREGDWLDPLLLILIISKLAYPVALELTDLGKGVRQSVRSCQKQFTPALIFH